MVPAGNKAKRISSVNHTTKQFIIITVNDNNLPLIKIATVNNDNLPSIKIVTVNSNNLPLIKRATVNNN